MLIEYVILFRHAINYKYTVNITIIFLKEGSGPVYLLKSAPYCMCTQ